MHVQHEGGERALQPGQLPLEHRKARAGHGSGGLEIKPAKPLTNGNMVLRLEAKLSRLAPAAHFLIIVFVCAFRHIVHRQVGQRGQLGAKRLVSFSLLCRGLVHLPF